ncbi:MAG: glycine--tRNA ligase subunit beta, partial [Pseudomonadales bacterium]|nr:glycine--tRNA ligase subunit beta [Pseudomonadales bacterium]
METRDLLIEIGTEELPPKSLRQLMTSFADNLAAELESSGFAFSGVHGYATPRRLAAIVNDLAACQPDQAVERRGPSVAAAFDDGGGPTKAATGFARSCGVAVEDLERMETDKGTWPVFRQTKAG